MIHTCNCCICSLCKDSSICSDRACSMSISSTTVHTSRPSARSSSRYSEIICQSCAALNFGAPAPRRESSIRLGKDFPFNSSSAGHTTHTSRTGRHACGAVCAKGTLVGVHTYSSINLLKRRERTGEKQALYDTPLKFEQPTRRLRHARRKAAGKTEPSQLLHTS